MTLRQITLVGSCLFLCASIATADEQVIALADGKITLQAPKGWERQKPRTNIVDYEFAAPAVEGDKTAGRVTVMGAGGSVEANINRWIGQFSQADGTATRERAVIEKGKVDGQEVHLVDIAGTFKDQRGPFAPATIREDYRMMGAIIVTEKLGQYFVKLYGPKKTIAANEKAFKEMIESLKVK